MVGQHVEVLVVEDGVDFAVDVFAVVGQRQVGHRLGDVVGPSGEVLGHGIGPMFRGHQPCEARVRERVAAGVGRAGQQDATARGDTADVAVQSTNPERDVID